MAHPRAAEPRPLRSAWILLGLGALLSLACSESSSPSEDDAAAADEDEGSLEDEDGSGGDPGTGGSPAESGGGTGGQTEEGTGGETESGTGGAPLGPPIVDPMMGGDPPELGETATIFIVGDSTAAEFPESDPTGRVGWGVPFPTFFDESIVVVNAAQSGRSSKSFYHEGHWAAVKAQIQEGDYVFIQFAHNDEKIEDPLRYTDPATTFRDYLNVYIGESRQLGGFPVLLTPVSRRSYEGTSAKNTHGLYPDAVKEVGLLTTTPVIDMTQKTAAFLEEVGQFDSFLYFAEADNTHTSALGAETFAGLVVEGMVELALPPTERLLPE